MNRLRTLVAGTGRMLRQLSESGSLSAQGNVSGKRVVVTADGGRVRLREKKRGKTKKGRQRFQPQWREPRLFMIYVVDDEGRQDRDFLPIIDGGMGSCDELFASLPASQSRRSRTLSPSTCLTPSARVSTSCCVSEATR